MGSGGRDAESSSRQPVAQRQPEGPDGYGGRSRESSSGESSSCGARARVAATAASEALAGARRPSARSRAAAMSVTLPQTPATAEPSRAVEPVEFRLVAAVVKQRTRDATVGEARR